MIPRTALIASLALFSACTQPEEVVVVPAATATPAPLAEAPLEAATGAGPTYSPFVLQVAGGDVDNISFKDVGLSLNLDSAAAYEAVAIALATEIQASAALTWSAEVAYMEEVTKPENHVFCGDRHIYVDLWRSQSPERWGYSLWSGCGEESQFAWTEVPTTGQEWMEHVEPLAAAIVESIGEADATGCYRRTC